MVTRVAVNDDLSLAAAADALSVHYQTAYRWVRQGRLPARVDKGAYRIARVDVTEFDARRHRGRSPQARNHQPDPLQRSRHRQEFATALTDGDEHRCRSLAHRTLSTMTVAELLDDIVAPTMRGFGAQWHAGNLSIWTEHRATAIVGRLLGDSVPNPRGRRRGTAVVASVSGDRHAIATEMATAVLREDNWRVHHLGGDIPADEIVDFCRAHRVDIAVLTVTMPVTAGLAATVQHRLAPFGVTTIVGGPGKTLAELLTTARTAVPARSGHEVGGRLAPEVP